MSAPDLAVRRPVTVLMATVAVAVFGYLAAKSRPVELLPSLSYPTLTIQTTYPDAAPVSVEQFVTRPIEESVGVIPGVRDMRSTSRAGFSEVVLEFDWGEDMDFAALDVREKLGVVQLPREAEAPRVLRFDPSLDPVMRLALTGERPLTELRDVADRWLKPRLEAVPGVAAAKVRGGLDPEVQVEADEDRLAALGLTLDDLSRALQAENINQPGGTLQDFGAVYLVRTLHEFGDLDQLRDTVVRETPEGRIRVGDVATVTRGHRDRTEITRLAAGETVELALHREGDANTVAVAAEVREELGRLREAMDDDLKLTVLNDQSLYISAAVGQVQQAAVVGGIFAILVLFFFLRDARPTGIIALAIPASVIAVFLPLQQLGISLNIMSLGGLALGIGMLVDNSIVVLESIDRHRRLGLPPREASVKGAGDVAGAVTAATLTTVAVFLPIVFVEGVAGQLFRDLAVTVCVALLASLVVALTVIPALAGLSAAKVAARRATLFPWDRSEDLHAGRPWTLRLGPIVVPPVGNGRHWFSRVLTVLLFPARLALALLFGVLALAWILFRRGFDLLAWPLGKAVEKVGFGYPAFLRGALRLRWLVLATAVGLFVVSILAAGRLGTNLVPDLSQGEFAFRLSLPAGTPLGATDEVVQRIAEPLAADDTFERVFTTVGTLPSTASGRQARGENLAQVNVVLGDGATAEDEAAAIARVRRILGLYPQVEAELVRPSVLTVRPAVAVDVFADDLGDLEDASAAVVGALDRIESLRDVTTTVQPGSPEIRVEIDRDRAAALGVHADRLGQSLRRQVRGETVGQFREEEKRLDIRLRASERAREHASDVASLRVRLEDGTAVPISAIASVEVGRGPAAIHRRSGARMARITAWAPAADLGATLTEVERSLAGVELPVGAVAELSGQDEELEVSLQSLKLAIGLAIFLVYVVMAMQFESLLHPFVILLAVPMGVVGVVVALVLTETALGVLVLIGAVMLAGIVVNNAIVLVDAINRRRREGERRTEAILGGARERLRPILMTTATTVLGLSPMALGLGAGDELRQPLAVTVIGGLTGATLLTLVVVPCLYRVLSREKGLPEPEPEASSSAWPADTREASA